VDFAYDASWLVDQMHGGKMFVARSAEYQPPWPGGGRVDANTSAALRDALYAPFLGDEIHPAAIAIKGDAGEPHEPA